jgi:hypothetical protein
MEQNFYSHVKPRKSQQENELFQLPHAMIEKACESARDLSAVYKYFISEVYIQWK